MLSLELLARQLVDGIPNADREFVMAGKGLGSAHDRATGVEEHRVGISTASIDAESKRR